VKPGGRTRILVAVSVAAVLGGSLVYLMPERARELEPISVPLPEEASPATPAYSGELHERFQQAAVMLHARQPQHALTALERVIMLAPNLPEARVNAGFALYELSNMAAAQAQFQKAIDLRPGQANAYYGLAMTLEALGDLDGALGAMRTYVHLVDEEDPHVRKARSAIWEWESQRKQRLAAASSAAASGEKQPPDADSGEGG
jgi:tetratricopeptide (TPR) repeat protein